MTNSRHERIKELVSRAGEADAARRAELLDAECAGDPQLRAEVESLLHSLDQSPDVVEHSPVTAATEGVLDELGRIGARVDRYQIESVIGRGGMGVVYRAQRVDGAFDQVVAIKYVHAGGRRDEVVRRFRREQETLATLNHPGITRLLDAGVDESGSPYIVMEYVDGEPITAYCDRRKLGLRQRVELILHVCDALMHAHSHLFIHRDLKPSNILVTSEGSVKLLDFGIAKLLDDQAGAASKTMTRDNPLTPEYASPEQLRGGAMTTATDIYGLGVVLYELLAGRRPFELGTMSPYDLTRTICDVQPPAPSTAVLRAARARDGRGEPPTRSLPDDLRRWSRALRGDLDAITQRALRKEPDQRYASVEQFADDLRAWLAGLPVRARRGTFLYRARKFARRNLAASIATAAALLAVIGGSVGIAIESWRVAEQRDAAERSERRARVEATRAQHQAEIAQRVSSLLVDLFKSADPEQVGSANLSAKDVLDRGAERLRGELTDEPEVRAPLLEAVAHAYQNLAEYEPAAELLAEALKLRAELHGAESEEVAAVLNDLGLLRQSQGRLEEAVELQTQALGIRRRLHEQDSPEVAQSMHNLAFAYQALGRLDDAERMLGEVLQMRRRLFGESSQQVLTTINNMAMVQYMRREVDAARRSLEQAVEVARKMYGDHHPRVAVLLNNLALVLHEVGDYDEAEQRYLAALEIRRKCFPPEHPEIANSYNNLGGLAFDRGDYEKAADWFEQALRMQRAVAGDEHPFVQTMRRNLARALLKLGRLDEADSLLNQALQNLRETYPPNHLQVIGTELVQAELLLNRGATDEAEALLRTVLDHASPEDYPLQVAEAHVLLAQAAIDSGQAQRARELATRALAVLEGQQGSADTLIERAQHVLRAADALLGESASDGATVERP